MIKRTMKSRRFKIVVHADGNRTVTFDGRDVTHGYLPWPKNGIYTTDAGHGHMKKVRMSETAWLVMHAKVVHFRMQHERAKRQRYGGTGEHYTPKEYSSRLFVF